MPQAEFLTNEILALIGVPIGLLFADLSCDGGVDESEDDYIEVFMEFAYQTDRLCFLLDIALQKLFSVVLGYTFLNTLTGQSGYQSLNSQTFNNEFTWLNSQLDPVFTVFYAEYLNQFWDIKL